MKEMDRSQRPRERMQEHGPEVLSDQELLALLLRTGSSTEDVMQLARRILSEAGSVGNLSRLSVRELQEHKGVGPAKACELAAVFELGRRAAREKWSKQKLDSPEAVHELMAAEMSGLRQETLQVLLLDTRHRLMRRANVSTGNVNEAIADPREILRPAIVHNAYGLILVHNHPSGDPTPSQSDRTMTRSIASACQLMRVSLVDHVIIGTPSPDHPAFFSFREAGLL